MGVKGTQVSCARKHTADRERARSRGPKARVLDRAKGQHLTFKGGQWKGLGTASMDKRRGYSELEGKGKLERLCGWKRRS